MEEVRDKVTHEVEETLGIFEEYKQRFAEAIDKEKKRVRKQAEQESADVMAEAGQKAHQIAEKTIRAAEKESTRIITRSRELAEQIISETDRSAKSVTELKQKVEQEIEEAKGKVRQEAAVVAETTQKAEKTISEARNKVKHELEESVRAVAEIKQKLEQITEAAVHEAKKKFERRDKSVPSAPAITREEEEIVEPIASLADDSGSQKADSNKLFMGTLELDITPPEESAPLQRLLKLLSQISGLQVLSVSGSAGEKRRVKIFIAKTLPLLSILKEMSPIKSATEDKKDIQVMLETGDGWAE